MCLQPTKVSAAELKAKLLSTEPPVLGYLDQDAFCLDPRTLAEADYPLLFQAIMQAFAELEAAHS